MNIREFFKQKLNLFKILTAVFFINAGLLMLWPLIFDIETSELTKTDTNKKRHEIALDSTQTQPIDSCSTQRHFVRWTDYSGKRFKAEINVCTSNYVEARKNREETIAFDYNNMVRNDNTGLNRLVGEMAKIIKENHLNYDQAIEMVVSMVQNIPYYLVIPESKDELMQICLSSGQTDSFAYRYLSDNKPYIDNIGTFGVQSPVEFAYNLKGDCDTRTVFLYSVLKKMNVDVIVLNSDVKQHSILGVKLDGQYGDEHFMDNNTGKNYLVWETTTTGFPPGVMPDYDSDDWKIVLN